MEQVLHITAEPIALRVKDAARYMGVKDPDYVRTLVDQGYLRARKAPGTKQVLHITAEPIALRVKDAARYMGVKDPDYVRTLVDQGYLRARKAPGTKTMLISVQSIHDYLGDRR